MDLLFRPFPASPAEILANQMADVWRTLGCRPPSASRSPAGQAYRGSSGSGSGHVGGDGVGSGSGLGNGGGSGRGTTMLAGVSRGALPGFTGMKG